MSKTQKKITKYSIGHFAISGDAMPVQMGPGVYRLTKPITFWAMRWDVQGVHAEPPDDHPCFMASSGVPQKAGKE